MRGTNTTVDSPFDFAFKGKPLETSSLETLTLASTWLDICIQSHHACGRQTPQPLPTRLIDVGSLESGKSPFLLQSTGGQLGNWFALSYCWGKALPFKTEIENLKQHMQEIPLDQLPAVFRDAVHITRRLECRYLWIDALCIIQDSPDDWKTEAAQMHSIYSNATLTIVAEAAIDPTYGIFASGDSRRHNFDRAVALSCITSDKGRSMKARPALPSSMGSKSPVSQRGWTLQEDLLSPRVLRFSAEQVFWACQKFRCCEAAPTTDDWEQDLYFRRFGTKNSFFDMNVGDTEEDIYFRFWNVVVVNSFTRRSLFKQTDTMFAVAGLAREIQRHTDSAYIAGLWSKNLPEGLLWQACRSGKRPSGKESYIAPSWSWASMTFNVPDGDSRPQTYQFLKHMEETAYDSEIIAVVIMPSVTEDLYGQIEFGFLVIAGNWRCVDDFKELPTPFYEDWNNTRSMWDKESKQSDLLLPKQIVCNLDEGTTCIIGDELNIFGQGNLYLQILPNVLGVIYALILAPAEPIEGNEVYRRIGIAQIPKDDGMADGWESAVFTIV